MHKIHGLLGVVICALLLACNAGSTNQNDFISQQYAKDQTEIKNLVREIFDSAQKKELDKLDAFHLYGPKFTKFSGRVPRRQDAAAAQKAEREAFEAIDKGSYELDEFKVDVFENVAIATFVINYDIQIGQDQSSGSSRSTLVFVKDGSDWKITHEHFSPINDSP